MSAITSTPSWLPKMQCPSRTREVSSNENKNNRILTNTECHFETLSFDRAQWDGFRMSIKHTPLFPVPVCFCIHSFTSVCQITDSRFRITATGRLSILTNTQFFGFLQIVVSWKIERRRIGIPMTSHFVSGDIVQLIITAKPRIWFES